MTFSALDKPNTDPTPIFEAFRGSYATELLTAAVAHFNLFGRLAERAMPASEVAAVLNLPERPATVLFTALRALELLSVDGQGRLQLTALAREHLLPGARFDVGDYVGLAAQSPGVLAMVECLRTNRPAVAEGSGTAFIYRDGVASAMEQTESARNFTLALAGRAKNVAPYLAEIVSLAGCRLLVDVGGGTGIYSVAFLQRNPQLHAVVLDRPEVLKVAHEMAAAYRVLDRLECRTADMFRDPLPTGADVILLSNVLHDWDVPECRALIRRCAAALAPSGRLLIHDVFLNDDLGGPLAVALYSAALFTLTEGRAYSTAEYRGWLTEAGLTPGAVAPTRIHCGALVGTK
jgi:SAM-dependent methyltransferase